MKSTNIVTPTQSADLPRCDSPEDLVRGLGTVVRAGINNRFSDAVWVYYFDPADALALAEDAAFQKLLKLLRERGHRPTHTPNFDINVRPHYSDLVRVQAARRGANSNGTTGGGHHPINVLSERRFIAAPAQPIPGSPLNARTPVEIDISKGISFDGLSLAVAMFRQGYELEVLRHVEGNPAGYREKQFGEFFMSNLFPDQPED